MRRVFAVIGFSSFFASLICIYFGKEFQIAVIVACAILVTILLSNKATRKLSILYVLFVTVAFSSLNVMLFNNNSQEIANKYCNKEIEVVGELLEEPTQRESGFGYTFKLCNEDNVNFSLYTKDSLFIKPGDKIKGTFNFSSTYSDFAERNYFSAYSYNTEQIETFENNDKFNLSRIRTSLKQRIIDNTTYGRSLTVAIVFGDTTRMRDDLYYDLLKCGLLHATATSGLHLTIVTGFIFVLLTFMGISRKKSAVFTIILIILFMIVIGFKFSLMRAGIMMIMYFLANLFDREGDSFNSIGLATAVLIALNPYTVVSCSFLLSASATIGMLFIFSPMYAKFESIFFTRFALIKRVLSSIVASALQSVSAILFTLPVVCIFFGYFSIAGIVANMVLYLFISAVLVSGIAICITADLPYIPEVLGKLNDVSSLVIVKMVDIIGKFKYCLINIEYDFLAIWFAVCSIIVAIAVLLYYFWKIKKKTLVKLCSVLCINALIVMIVLNIIIPNKRIDISVQNSGGAINLTTVVNNNTIVIDGGGNYCERRVKSALIRKAKEEISCLVIPCSTERSYAAGQVLSKSIPTKNVVINSDSLDTNRYVIDGIITNLNDCSKITIDDLTIEFIKQNNSTVLYLTNSECSILLVDGNARCSKLPYKYKTSDLVIISNKCPDDINAISAKQAIIFTYDEAQEQKAANLFSAYSLRDGAMNVRLDDKITVSEV